MDVVSFGLVVLARQADERVARVDVIEVVPAGREKNGLVAGHLGHESIIAPFQAGGGG